MFTDLANVSRNNESLGVSSPHAACSLAAWKTYSIVSETSSEDFTASLSQISFVHRDKKNPAVSVPSCICH